MSRNVSRCVLMADVRAGERGRVMSELCNLANIHKLAKKVKSQEVRISQLKRRICVLEARISNAKYEKEKLRCKFSNE